MPTLTRVQLRGYTESGAESPYHVTLVTTDTGESVWDTCVIDGDLDAPTRAAIASVLNTARVSLGLGIEARIIAQIEATNAIVIAGAPEGTLRTVLFDDTTDITTVITALAARAGATLPV